MCTRWDGAGAPVAGEALGIRGMIVGVRSADNRLVVVRNDMCVVVARRSEQMVVADKRGISGTTSMIAVSPRVRCGAGGITGPARNSPRWHNHKIQFRLGQAERRNFEHGMRRVSD